MEFVFLILATAASAGAQECYVPPFIVQCDEPREQMQLTGFFSSAPLFQDADIRARCVGKRNNFFVGESTKEVFKPFSGIMSCNPNEVITGIEVCFQVELRYIIPSCTGLEEGYSLDMDNVQAISTNSKKQNEILCPDDMALISLELQQVDETGDINVFGECASILEL